MKRIHIDVVCDEGHGADVLSQLANYLEKEERFDEYDFDNGTAVVEKYDDDDEKTLNKTPEQILAYHRDVYIPAESIMREMCRKYISRFLMDTSEDNKKTVEIHIEPDGAFGMSSLEMPTITAAWQDPSSGEIYFDEEYNGSVDIDNYPIHELIQIVEQIDEN